MNHLRPAIVVIAFFTLLTGIVLPAAFTGLAAIAFPHAGGGSLISRDGKVVGSALLGQAFTQARYFQPRPSATTDTDPDDSSKTVPSPYNAAGSGGSNLGATSKALIDRVASELKDAGPAPVPADAVTTSASGLDPDISPANAQRQVARVAAARGLPEARLRALVAEHIQGRLLGVLGEPRVNVLALNLALDGLAH